MAQSETLEIIASVRDRLTSGFSAMSARSRVAFASLASMIGTVGKAFTSLRVLIAGFWTRQVLRFFDRLGELASPEIGRRYQETVKKFGEAWNSVLTRLADRILPGVTDALDGLAKWFDSHKDSVAASIETMFAPFKWAASILGTIKTNMEKFVFSMRSGGQAWSDDAQQRVFAMRREELAREGVAAWRRGQQSFRGQVPFPDEDSMRGIYDRAGEQAYNEVFTRGIQMGEKAIAVEKELAAEREKGAKITEDATRSIGFGTMLLLQTADAFRTNFSGALSAVLLGTMRATNALREFAKAMLESVTRSATDALAGNLLKGFFSLFPKITTGGGPGAYYMSPGGHARGTVTDGPELAWIGDNPSGREAVIPMDDGRHVPVRMIGGGRGVVNNYYISAIDTRSFATAFRDAERSHGMTRLTMLRNANRDKATRTKFRVR